MGLILDSSIEILAERSRRTVPMLLTDVLNVSGDQNAALSSVGLSELVHGIYRAPSPEIRIWREAYLRELLNNVTVYPFTQETAWVAGEIDGQQRAKGVTVPFADLLIGATALSAGFSVLTSNARHFRLIPGLTVVPF
jgi:predicted nucleic acid-binding protein